MTSVWFLVVYLMAAVMGHGGDGAGAPPPPPGGNDWWNNHQQDGAPRKRTRGKAKNLGLKKIIDRTGRSDITFDEAATCMPIGKLGSFFTREASMYIWREIPMDVQGWDNVSEVNQNKLFEFLRSKFKMDWDPIDDYLVSKKQGGIMAAIKKRYKNRKANAKEHYNLVSSDGVDARQHPPVGMKPENWLRSCDHFCTPEHKKKSEINKAVRKKQTTTYRGGTSSFATHCHKKEIERYEAYRIGHTGRQGTFDTPQNEANYQRLRSRFESERQRLAEEEGEGGGSSSQRLDEVGIFEEVLGKRRGHVRGIGTMPCPRESLPHHTSTQPQFSQEEFNSMIKLPDLQEQMVRFFNQYYQSQKLGNQGGSSNSGDHADEDEDEDEGEGEGEGEDEDEGEDV